MIVLINILAYLFILSAVGFLAAVAVAAWAAFQIYRTVNRVKGMIQPPKEAALQIARTGKGIVQRDGARVHSIAKILRGAISAIILAKSGVLKGILAVGVGGAKEAAQAKSTMRHTLAIATLGFDLAKRIIALAAQIRRENGSRPATPL